jgi:exonuclease SbcD
MENYGRTDPATGLNSRFADFLASLDSVVAHALSAPVDLVVFAGDAFRTREPSPTHQNAFAAAVRRISQAGIPLLLVVGNHDLPSFAANSSPLDVYATLEIPGVIVAREPRFFRVQTRSGLLQVAALPALPPAVLLQRQERRLDPAARQATARARLAEIISDLALQVDGSAPALLAAHLAVEGAAAGSESFLLTGGEATLPPSRLADPTFAYVALGHFHKHQDLNPHGRPPIVYPGSLERINFSEENEEKGFVEVELLPGETRYRFLPTQARRFLTLEAEVSGPEATQQLLGAISSRDIGGAIVRVIAHMVEETPLDDQLLRKALAPAAWACPIIRQIQNPRQRARLPELAARANDPLAALDLYLKTKRFSAAREDALRALARRLLAEAAAEQEGLLREEPAPAPPTAPLAER